MATKHQIKFRGEASLPVKIFKEDRMYVAYTPVLDLSSSGHTAEEAQKNIGEAIAIFFTECFKDGTLEEVLLSLGWTRNKPSEKLKPPKVVDVEVPIPAYS